MSAACGTPGGDGNLGDGTGEGKGEGRVTPAQEGMPARQNWSITCVVHAATRASWEDALGPRGSTDMSGHQEGWSKKVEYIEKRF